jgi:hypothetical protein
MFTMSLSMAHFVVTRDTTYEQYVSPLTSGRARAAGILPPRFPNITVHSSYANRLSDSYNPVVPICHGRPLQPGDSAVPQMRSGFCMCTGTNIGVPSATGPYFLNSCPIQGEDD